MSQQCRRGSLKLFQTWLIMAVIAIGSALPAAAEAPVGPEVKQVAAGSNALGIKLFPELSKTSPDNLFFSPFSIHIAFAMPFAGAAGATRAEMENVFGYPADSQGLTPAFGEYLKSFPGFGGTPAATAYEFTLANRIWAQKTYPFSKTYLDTVKTLFASELQLVDFMTDAKRIRVDINSWVETLTQGKIKNLIPEGVLSELTRLVLVNAVYFKGIWESEFPKAETADADFYARGTNATKVPMMHQTGRFGLATQDGYQCLRLPYKGGTLAMFVFLPKTRDGIKALETALSARPPAEWAAGLDEAEVYVSFPRFKIESQFSLPPALKSLGVVQAFSEAAADFSRMIDPVNGKAEPGLFISDAIHKAFVAVDEQGTEAAAATAVVMQTKSMSAPPAIFNADHPFLFTIVHEPTSTVLFLGRVSSPAQ